MSRSVLIVLIVAALSGWISRGERLAGPAAYATDWVRTVDGWEPSRVVVPFERSAAPAVHPAVIATFQIVASLFVLAAFPAKAAAKAPQIATSRRPHVRPASRITAAG